MKTFVAAMLLSILAISTAFAESSTKISLEAKNMPIKDAMAELSKQSQTSIVVDPKIQANVNLSLSSTELDNAMDAIAKLNKLTWKKMRFAKSSEDKLNLDQIKMSILALANMPMMGVQIDDPATKQSTVFAKNLSSAPDTVSVKLPEGYTWTTVYVVLPSEVATKPIDTETKNKVADLSKSGAQRTMELANMSSQDRQQVFLNDFMNEMNLAPETRQAILADRFQAMRSMGEQYHDQYREDMHKAFRSMRGPDDGGGNRRQDGERRDRGNRRQNRN